MTNSSLVITLVRNYLSSGRHDISNNFESSSAESVCALAISLHKGVPNMTKQFFSPKKLEL